MMRRFRQFPQIGGAKALPYDAEVEWLKSDGVAFIDTGIVVRENGVLELGLSADVTKDWRKLLFAEWISATADAYGLRVFSAGGTNGCPRLQCAYGQYGSAYSPQTIKAGERIDVKFDVAGMSIVAGANTGSISRVVSFKSLKVLYNGYFFGLKYYEDGVLLNDIVTVRIGTEGCLYDRINGTTLRNSSGVIGSGFIVGPDKREWVNPLSTTW